MDIARNSAEFLWETLDTLCRYVLKFDSFIMSTTLTSKISLFGGGGGVKATDIA
jgi:hypothetical protein